MPHLYCCRIQIKQKWQSRVEEKSYLSHHFLVLIRLSLQVITAEYSFHVENTHGDEIKWKSFSLNVSMMCISNDRHFHCRILAY